MEMEGKQGLTFYKLQIFEKLKWTKDRNNG